MERWAGNRGDPGGVRKTGDRTLVAVRKSNRRNAVVMSTNDGIHRILKAASKTDRNE